MKNKNKKSPNLISKKIATIALTSIFTMGLFSFAPAFAASGSMTGGEKPSASSPCSTKMKKKCSCKKSSCKCKKPDCKSKKKCKSKAKPSHNDNSRYND